MISAFTARAVIELKPRDKSKIETILAHGDRVFVGLNTGSLRIYRLLPLPEPSPDDALPKPGQDSAAPSVTNTPAKSTPSKRLPVQGTSDSATSPPNKQARRPKTSELLREIDKFSSRAVEQLAIIKEANVLVSLSNHYVSLHDLASYQPVPGAAPLLKTKNATCFAVTSNIFKDGPEGIPEIISRLAVAVKRRLLVWRWHDSELDGSVAEIVLSESIRSISWASATKVVCGMNGGFDLVDVATQKIDTIVGPGAIGGGGQAAARFGAASMGYMGLGGYVPKPLSTRLADGQMLLAKDSNTLFVTDEAKPLDKKQISWQMPPESIGYNYPYILALHVPAKGLLEVRNPDTLSLLQTMSLPGAAQLHIAPPTVSLTHAAKGFHISSERCVWKMEATDYDTQISEFVAGGDFDEAISVLGMLEDALLKNKAESLRQVKMLKAEMLFRQKKFREGMDLFNEDDVHAPPERVLKLFPRLIAGEHSGYPSSKDSDSESDYTGEAEVVDADSSRATQGATEQSSKLNSAPQDTTPARGGISRLLNVLGKPEGDSNTPGNGDSKEPADEAGAASGPGKQSGIRASGPPRGKDLVNAVRELNSYLAGTRARLQRVIDPATGKLKPRAPKNGAAADPRETLLGARTNEADEELEETELQNCFRLVDTTLFRSYMFSQPSLAGSLFRIPNFCDPDVVNKKLLEHNRFNELVDFFYGKKLHRQALELLKKFGDRETPDEAAPMLHGPQRTVVYLQNLPSEMIDLTLEFAQWTLRADPKLGMEVFVADTENAETLPRERVVNYLGDIDVQLEIQYLDHIISELNDMTPEFHDRLAALMITQLKDKKTHDDKWKADMSRLVRFLGDSNQYSLSRAFSLIPKDDPGFYEAQAVVLCGMDQHKQALEIYVFKMNDYTKAEEYCNRIYLNSGSTGGLSTQQPGKASTSKPSQVSSVPATASSFADFDSETELLTSTATTATASIYHTLLALYLSPPPPQPSKPLLEPALNLLSRHGSRLPALATLGLIPDDLPVRDLESYFRGRIRAANSVLNQNRVLVGLRNTLLIDSQAKLLLGGAFSSSTAVAAGPSPATTVAGGGGSGRNRRVVIWEERVCGVCHKRLSTSVVAVLPDNTVVHYGCRSKLAGSLGLSGSKDFGAVAAGRPGPVRRQSSAGGAWGAG